MAGPWPLISVSSSSALTLTLMRVSPFTVTKSVFK